MADTPVAGTVTKAVENPADKIQSTLNALDALEARLSNVVEKGNQPVYTDGVTPGQVFGATDGRVYAEPVNKAVMDKWGFKHFGQFAQEVAFSKANGVLSQTIRKAYGAEYVTKAALSMGELVGSDGGFLVPPEFSNKIFEKVYNENNLIAKTDQYQVTGNSISFPQLLETSRATGSRWGGVQSYWLQEGGTATRSKPAFGRLQLQLNKLMTLGVATEELIQDSGTAISSYLNKVFSNEIAFMISNSIFRGTGVGQPLGILNALDSNSTGCTLSVSKETGQTLAVNPLVTENITKMWARRFTGMGGGQGNYVWFVNQDVTPYLYTMTLGIGAAGVATYMPPGGLSGKPYATLMGAPVIETEFNSTVGTTGDIILADLSQYVTISKGGQEMQNSMHLYFDSDQQAFRISFRVDGKPWWVSALTPFQGTAKQSPFVILETRS